MGWISKVAKKLAPTFVGVGGTIEEQEDRLRLYCDYATNNLSDKSSWLGLLARIRPEPESKLTHEQALYLTLGVWGASGLPVVHVEDKRFCAAMMGTSCPSEVLEFVKPPWPAFVVELPTGSGLHGMEVVDRKDYDPETWEIVRLLVLTSEQEGQMYWFIRATDGTDADDKSPNERTSITTLQDAIRPVKYDDDRWSTSDLRAMELVGKLVVSVCIGFHAGITKRISEKNCKRSFRTSPFPTTLQYTIGSPIKHDVTSAISNYVRTGRASGKIAVQTFVRGHWKQQPYGERLSRRKFIHIEPYWRGPDDASVIVRPHVLTKSGVQ